MSRKKLTVYDYLKSKGERQLSIMFVHNVDEARAAEEAGIDMICTAHDAPQFGVYTTFEDLKRIREAAPSCFMQSDERLRGVPQQYPIDREMDIGLHAGGVREHFIETLQCTLGYGAHAIDISTCFTFLCCSGRKYKAS